MLYYKTLAGFWGYSENKIVLHALGSDYRGRGLAKYFWSAACRELFRQGHSELVSSISFSNTPALNLYISLGFRFRNSYDLYHLMIQ
ncbi:GNAT family N-acetyltransferase [Leptolyngbyaceae cyanobacterium UHCC 1019]